MHSSSSRGRLSALHSSVAGGGRGQPRGPFRVRVTAVEGRNLPDCDLRLPDSRVVMTVFAREKRSPLLVATAAGAVGDAEEANRASHTADSVVSPMLTDKFSEFHTTDYSNKTYEPYWNSSTEFIVEDESESILFELYMKPPAASVTEALKARGIIPKTAAPLAHKDLSVAAAKANVANEVLRQSQMMSRNSRCPAATKNTLRTERRTEESGNTANKGNGSPKNRTEFDIVIVGDSSCRTLPPPPFPLSSRLSEATDSGIGIGMGMAAHTEQYRGGSEHEEEGSALVSTDHSERSSPRHSAVSSKKTSRLLDEEKEHERASSTCRNSEAGCRAHLSSFGNDPSATPARGGAQFAARDLARASVLSTKRGLARADPTFDANKFPEGGMVVVGIRASMSTRMTSSSPQSSSLPPSALNKRKATSRRRKEEKGDTPVRSAESSSATISIPSSPPRSQHRVEGTDGVGVGGGWEDEEEKDDWDFIVTCPDYLLGRTVVPVSCAMRPRSWLENATLVVHSTTLLPVSGDACAAVMTDEREPENNNSDNKGAVSADCSHQDDIITTGNNAGAGVGGWGTEEHYEVYDCWHRLTDCRKGGPEIRVRIEVILGSIENTAGAAAYHQEATKTMEKEESGDDVKFQEDPSNPAAREVSSPPSPTTLSPQSLLPLSHGHTTKQVTLYNNNNNNHDPRKHNSHSVVLPAGWYFMRNCHNTYLCLAPTRALQTVVMGDWCRIYIEPVCDPAGWDEPTTSTSTSLRTQAHVTHDRKEGEGRGIGEDALSGGHTNNNNSSKGFVQNKSGSTTTITPSTSKTSLSHFFSNSAVFGKFGKHNKTSPSGEDVVKGKIGESVCGEDSAFSFYSPPQHSVQIQELQQKIKLSFSAKLDFTGGAGRQRCGVLYTLRSSTSLALLAAAHEKTKKKKKKGGGIFPIIPTTNPLENLSAAVKSTIFLSNTKRNEKPSSSAATPSAGADDKKKEKEKTPTVMGEGQNRFLKASGDPQTPVSPSPSSKCTLAAGEDEDDSTQQSVRHNFVALYKALSSSSRSNASPDAVQYSVGLTDIEDPTRSRGCLFEILPHPKHEGRWLIHSPAVGVNLVAEPGGWGAGYTSVLGRATDWATFDLIRAPSTPMRTPPHVSEGTYLIETCQKTFICGIKKKITHRRGNDEGVKVTLRLEEREGENAHLAAFLPPVYSMQTAFGTFICYEHGRCEARGTRAGAWEKFEILPHPTLPDKFTIYSCNFKTYLAVRGDEMGKIRNSDTISGDREAFGFIRVDGPLD